MEPVGIRVPVIRIYLELLAKRFDIEGDKLDAQVRAKLVKVADKHKLR